MLKCSQCGTENPNEATVCSSCSAPLTGAEVKTANDMVGQRIANQFTLTRNLGSGEIGVVYEAHSDDGARRVAVKVLHADVASTFGPDLLRWAKETAKVRHAKVAATLAANRLPDGTTYIITEFVPGNTLRDVLKSAGRLTPSRAADILFQLCSALAPIHRAGRPHANLKPENVFVEERPGGKQVVRIVDVGPPVIFGAHHLSGARQVVGSAKYFSPEQASGESVTLASDQFSLGIIGYLPLTGALPFFGATPDQLLKAIIDSEPKPIRERVPSVPESLARLVSRCLSKAPAQRYESLRGLATDLADAIRELRAAPVEQPQPSVDAPDPDATQAVDLSQLKLDQLDGERSEKTVAVGGDSELKALFEQALGEDAPVSSGAPEAEPNTAQQTLEPEPERTPPQPPEVPIPSPLQITGETAPQQVIEALAQQQAQPPAEAQSPDDLTAAFAAVIDDLDDDELDAVTGLGTTPLQPTPAKPANRTSGSLLPDDLLSGLETDEGDLPGARSVMESAVAQSPVASLSDFDEVEVLTEKDKKKRLARQTAALPRLGGLSRPWVVVFLLLLLVVTALGAKVIMSESEQEEAQERRKRERVAKAVRTQRTLAKIKKLKLVTQPTGAMGFVGGVAQGKTPYEQVVRGEKTFKVIFKRDGYADAEYEIVPADVAFSQEPKEVMIVLAPVDKKAPDKPAASQKDAQDNTGVQQGLPAVVRKLEAVQDPKPEPKRATEVEKRPAPKQTPPPKVQNKPVAKPVTVQKRKKRERPRRKAPKKKGMVNPYE